MPRILNIAEFCAKIGIFKTCAKTNRVSFGAYGRLLLNQIRDEWMRANLKKFQLNFLIDNENFDFNFYTKSLEATFGIKKLPIGFLNINSSVLKNAQNFDNENDNFLMRNMRNAAALTYLSSTHFYGDESQESMSFIDPNGVESLSGMDPLLFWQRERKNWWSKILNHPEFVKLSNSSSTCSNLLYKADSRDQAKTMESILHYNDLSECESNESLRVFFHEKNDEANFVLNNVRQLIQAETCVENVLEVLLNDSVEYRRRRDTLLTKHTNPTQSDVIVFRLNYRLAPFKACILYEDYGECEKKESSSLAETVHDLRKMLYYAQINTFTQAVKHESDLSQVYLRLDEMGVPFSIVIPTSVTKDGICRLRNRDTTLEEHLHISLVVKQFSSLSNALSF